MSTINNTILFLRIEHKIKQKDLSGFLGISTSYLSQIERGKRKPSIKLIVKICEFFELDLSEFLYRAIGFDDMKLFKKVKHILDEVLSFLTERVQID